jgi:flagellin
MSFRIGISQILDNLRIINRDFETVTNQLSTGKKINSSKDDPAAWARIKSSRAEFGQFTAINDSLNSVAGSIHIADSAMNAIGKTIEEMNGTLSTITENSPPLPVGDTERTRLIQSYNEMRNQIDQLATSSDEGARKIMSDPAVSGPGDWTIVIGPNGMTRTIRKEEVHTGPTGLDIPELQDTSTDAEIQDALTRLAAAKDVLGTRRRDLQMDSVAIAKAQEYNGKLASAHLTYAETAEAADMNEAGALSQSLQLRQQLSSASLKMLSDADAQVLQLLG